MPDRRQHWLASAFVLVAVVSVAGLVSIAGGWVQVGSEVLGLAVGAMLILLFWAGIRGR
ncbi:MAG: hypothetical protein H6959_04030 [Chromatiaceae bacterium]|nr:hypothetical protein [Gammaproteobacteria bacterium]MCP5299988.1 hypothetical protein [Chromatiaceae bacterium]MCP5422060.1 hypothetical protein [Chromatiaceae bacterium]